MFVNRRNQLQLAALPRGLRFHNNSTSAPLAAPRLRKRSKETLHETPPSVFKKSFDTPISPLAVSMLTLSQKKPHEVSSKLPLSAGRTILFFLHHS
jgi:hypothetical protein